MIHDASKYVWLHNIPGVVFAFGNSDKVRTKEYIGDAIYLEKLLGKRRLHRLSWCGEGHASTFHDCSARQEHHAGRIWRSLSLDEHATPLLTNAYS